MGTDCGGCVMRTWLLAGGWALTLLAASHPAGSDAADLHKFWEQRCQECHGHAGPFARETLSIEQGKLVGRRHDDLKQFLKSHRVPASLMTPVYNMLLAQTKLKPQFKAACGTCHKTAADLVRESVELRDGVLHGRASDRPVADYLKGHATIRDDEIPLFIELLTRIEREVHNPS